MIKLKLTPVPQAGQARPGFFLPIFLSIHCSAHWQKNHVFGGYRCVHNSIGRLFWTGKQCNHQNFNPSLLAYKWRLILMGMKQKKIKMANSKKEIFNYPQFSFLKHFSRYWSFAQFDKLISLCRVIRLSDVSSKKG